MLTTMDNLLRQGQRRLRRWMAAPGVREAAGLLAWGGSGFVLSAASLNQQPQPLAMSLICAQRGWRAVCLALGALAGYRLFWQEAGLQGIFWAAAGWILSLLPERWQLWEEKPLLIPALTGVITALTGLVFLFFRRDAGFSVYCLRFALAPISAWFFHRALHHREALTDWLCAGVAALALAQIAPVVWLSLGYVAAGLMAVWAPFPAAALTGLGLDLAQITRIPMAAMVCGGWLVRLLPFRNRRLRLFVPAAACLGVMGLCGIWDPLPLPGLVLGGILGQLLPPCPEHIRRRGETGMAQVRLELTAGVLAQTQRLLLETPEIPIDEAAVFQQAAERACGSCPSRENCQERSHLGQNHLHRPWEFTCRKPERIQTQLLRGQEHLKSLRSDHSRRGEYRSALIQQYQFLSDYLRALSDQLPRKGERVRALFRVEISSRSRGKERANGDSCVAFPGAACRYYVLLCDGMGTGLGAAQEGQTAADLLRQMLTAGFPPESALRSLNSLLVLRGQAGAVTMDLAEIRLDSGRVSLFKWGAGPSWLWNEKGAKKIGTATPPPGIRIADARETVIRLSLRRGEMLILLSDGVQAGECLGRKDCGPVLPPGELAQWLLEECGSGGGDDATVAVLRLHRRQMST